MIGHEERVLMEIIANQMSCSKVYVWWVANQLVAMGNFCSVLDALCSLYDEK